MKTRLALPCLLMALIALMAPSCAESFPDCRETVTCVVATGGNAAVSGGTSAGGSGGIMASGGAAGAPMAGAAGALPCGKRCDGNKPFCDVLRGKCVECLRHETCEDPAASACSSDGACSACADSSQCTHISGKNVCSGGACVACGAHSDCPLASASQCWEKFSICTPCSTDAQCAHVPGKTVCSDGTCVQCTGTKAEACGTRSVPLVCDSKSNTCSTFKDSSAGLCQPCVSDAQCRPGQLCVQETLFNGQKLGFACFWKEGETQHGAPANCALSGRPFVKQVQNAASIDGAIADICTLRVSSCLALKQFSDVDCATSPTNPMADDSKCGVVPGMDARCAVVEEVVFRCTMTCGSNEDCLSPVACEGAVTSVCKFN